jgi:hypothetical protein
MPVSIRHLPAQLPEKSAESFFAEEPRRAKKTVIDGCVADSLADKSSTLDMRYPVSLRLRLAPLWR